MLKWKLFNHYLVEGYSNIIPLPLSSRKCFILYRLDKAKWLKEMWTKFVDFISRNVHYFLTFKNRYYSQLFTLLYEIFLFWLLEAGLDYHKGAWGTFLELPLLRVLKAQKSDIFSSNLRKFRLKKVANGVLEVNLCSRSPITISWPYLEETLEIIFICLLNEVISAFERVWVF